MIAKREYTKRRIENLHMIYHRQMSSTVDIYIGTEETGIHGRSQYLTLYICRTDRDDVVKLRMSTVRNIFKFLSKKEFIPNARRLRDNEKML